MKFIKIPIFIRKKSDHPQEFYQSFQLNIETYWENFPFTKEDQEAIASN